MCQAISGPAPGDVASVPGRLDFDAGASIQGLRVGYFPGWMKDNAATEVDWSALESVRKLGMNPVEVSLPDWPYGSLNLILFAEAAAAFEELTLSGGGKGLKVQVPDAWPNQFRQARFLSAVDYVQTDRLRRRVAQEMARIFADHDRQLHRASVSDAARGLCPGVPSTQRLGPGSGASAAEVLTSTACAARRYTDRPPFR